jgi:uncharacterized protein DUF1569
VDPHLKKLRQEIASAVAGLSCEESSWHSPGKWCVAEILEHLYLTYTGTLKGLSRSLASGTPAVSEATLKDRVRAWIVLRFGYLPTGREAPQFTRPKGLPYERVIVELGMKIEEMDDALTHYAAQFGARTKVLDHVFLGPFSIDQWRKFHLVHGMHHLKQIRKIRSALSGAKTRRVT